MASWLLVNDVTVLDATGRPPVPGQSVLVRGDTICRVGSEVTAEAVPRGEPLRVIDGRAQTLMPGLVDAHCHVTFGEARQQEEQDLYTSVESRTLRTAWNMKKMLRAGVTGVSDPGGSYFISVAVREGVKAGIVEGPRMFSAGRFISTSNGIADWYPTAVGVPDSGIGMVANTRDEMITEVRRQVKNGVDLIKIGESPMGDYQAFMDDEIKAISEVVHLLGKRVTIHARGSANVNAAVNAEVDWIMHGNVMTDEVIERLAISQIPLCPVLTLIGNLRQWGTLVGVPQRKIDAYSQLLDKTAVSLHRAHEAGVRFITGTDTGFAVTPYGEWHGREIELLMEYAGLSAYEAIQAATTNAAVALGLEGQVGTVAEGMLADLILVDGDPLGNVRLLQDPANISCVISGGQPVTFDDNDLRKRVPYNRAQVISEGELTRALVYGADGPDALLSSSPAWTAAEGRELQRELARRQMASGTE